MKRQLLLPLAFITMLASCSKQEMSTLNDVPTPEFLTTSTVEGITKVALVSSNENTYEMLSFASTDMFDEKLDALSLEHKNYNSDFVSLHEELTDIELAELALNSNFNKNFIYESFEDNFSFSSMRNDYDELLSTWLSTSEPQIENHPSVEYPIDYGTMTFLNTQGCVKIGNTILIVNKDGYVHFTSNEVLKNTNNMERFLQNDFSVLNEEEVTSVLESQLFGNPCKNNKTKTFSNYYWGYTRMVVRSVGFRSWPWKAVAQSAISFYWRPSTSVPWKDNYHGTRIKQEYEMRNKQCGSEQTGATSEPSIVTRKHSLYHKANVYYFYEQWRVQNDGEGVKSDFYFNSQYHSLGLTW